MEDIQKQIKGKLGIICLNCLIMKSNFDELDAFASRNNILFENKSKTKQNYIEQISKYFYREFFIKKEAQEKYSSSIEFMGASLLQDKTIKEHSKEFDFFSKKELSDKFSDFCADLEISVFDSSRIEDYSLDLYLTRRTPILRTEAVIIRTGFEITLEKYQEILKILASAGEIASWTVFVTTPIGAYNIGLNKLIEDMENLKTWLYIIDPVHRTIRGITKGKKAKNYDNSFRDAYIEKIPRQPIRAPSQVKKISEYHFSESESYNSDNFVLYGIISEEDLKTLSKIPQETIKYKDLFRNFLIIDIQSGIPIFSYSSNDKAVDEVLISGFLNAMDGFISEIGGAATSMKDINYKGFYVQATYGNLIKTALFLSEPASQILIERMEYFVKQFERNYEQQIKEFLKDGDVSFFEGNKRILSLINEILEI